jgi:hypothetical protein
LGKAHHRFVRLCLDFSTGDEAAIEEMLLRHLAEAV